MLASAWIYRGSSQETGGEGLVWRGFPADARGPCVAGLAAEGAEGQGAQASSWGRVDRWAEGKSALPWERSGHRLGRTRTQIKMGAAGFQNPNFV